MGKERQYMVVLRHATYRPLLGGGGGKAIGGALESVKEVMNRFEKRIKN